MERAVAAFPSYAEYQASWWQTLAHPDSLPEPIDFEFVVTSESCGDLVVDEPSPFRSRGGEKVELTIWSVGEFRVPEGCGVVRIGVRVIDRSLAPGELVKSMKVNGPGPAVLPNGPSIVVEPCHADLT